MNAKPKQVDSALIRTFASAVPQGEYRMYSASTQLPYGIPWAGPTCQAVVVAASAYNSGDVPDTLRNIAPTGTVYLCREFRADPKGRPHWNVDDTVFYRDVQGNTWSVHSKDSSDHFTAIISGSAFGELVRDYNLPSASAGSLDAYRQGRAKLDFEKPFNR